MFESFLKASWWEPFRHPTRGSSSFHLHWGSSSGCDAGSSPDQSNPILYLGEQCHHLVPVECVTIVDLSGWEGEGMGPLGLIVCCGVAIRKAVRDMFPVNKSMVYINTPRTSMAQALRVTLQAHRKDW